MTNVNNEKYSILGVVSTVIMVLSTMPLFIGYLAKATVEVQKISIYSAAGGFALAYIVALIDLFFGKRNKNFSVLTVVMETLIVVVITLAYIIL